MTLTTIDLTPTAAPVPATVSGPTPAIPATNPMAKVLASLPRFKWTILVAIASVVGGLGLWEFIADVYVKNQLFLTGPIDIVERFWVMLTQEDLIANFNVSAQEFGYGLGLSIVIGVPLGLAMALVPAVKAAMQPWVSALYATPTVALSPLFILWFGLDISGKVAVVTLVSVFPIIINTEAGVRETSHDLVEMARVLGLSGLRLFIRIHLRSALPFVLAGIRLAIGKGIIGVVVAEMFGARAGLGFAIFNAESAYDTSGIFVSTAVLAISGVVLSAIVQVLENRAAPWRQR